MIRLKFMKPNFSLPRVCVCVFHKPKSMFESLKTINFLERKKKGKTQFIFNPYNGYMETHGYVLTKNQIKSRIIEFSEKGKNNPHFFIAIQIFFPDFSLLSGKNVAREHKSSSFSSS